MKIGRNGLPITPEELERRRIRHLETNQIWRKNHPEKVKSQHQRYRCKYPERLREQGKRHYAIHGRKHSEKQNAWLIKWRYANWEKVLAQCKLQRAVKSGKILKPECCNSCGIKAKLHGHHDDYSMPLAVKWLCSSCHKLLHLSFDRKRIV